MVVNHPTKLLRKTEKILFRAGRITALARLILVGACFFGKILTAGDLVFNLFLLLFIWLLCTSNSPCTRRHLYKYAHKTYSRMFYYFIILSASLMLYPDDLLIHLFSTIQILAKHSLRGQFTASSGLLVIRVTELFAPVVLVLLGLYQMSVGFLTLRLQLNVYDKLKRQLEVLAQLNARLVAMEPAPAA